MFWASEVHFERMFSVGFGDAVKSGFRNYVVFRGRARRSEYWFWALFLVLADAVLVGLVSTGVSALAVIGGVAFVAVLPPTLAVAIRRLHDTGKSGWFMLLYFVPLVGPLILLIWFCMDSASGVNKHGPNPKETASASAY